MKVKMNLIGNATFTISVDETVTFAMDPALDVKGSSLGFGIYRKKEPVYNETTFDNIDFWLLTHAHLDHIDVPGVKVIERHVPIIAAPSCKKTLNKLGVSNHVEYIDWNEQTTFEKDGHVFEITAIPAYHGYGKLVVKLMTRVNGYMIRIRKGNETKVIYVTSDTVYNQKVVDVLKRSGHVDMLIANLGEAKAPLPVTRKPITMDLQSLKQFAELTEAKYVIPLHIDDYSHFSTKRSEVERVYEVPNDGETKEFKL